IREPKRVGEAKFVLPCPVGGSGQHGQFAVGGAGEDQRAGALGEVDGLAFLLDGTGLGGEEVHQAVLRNSVRKTSPLTFSALRSIAVISWSLTLGGYPHLASPWQEGEGLEHFTASLTR